MQASVGAPAVWEPSCIEDQLLVALVNLKRAFHAGGLANLPVEPGAFPVLHHLAISGSARQGQVAEALGLDASTVSRHVRTLIKSGLLTSTRDAEDGRAYVLSVAPAGIEFLSSHLESRRELVDRGTAHFSPAERDEFVRLLNKFTQALLAAE